MTAKYAFINSEEGNYSIRSMCRWARVSRAGYYEWLNRPVSVTQRWRDELGDIIEVLFADSDATYGYRRIHAALVRAGRPCDPQTVRAIMAERGLVACQPRRSGPRTTIPADAKDLPDLVNRDFTADEPGLKLVGDITYIPTWQGVGVSGHRAGLLHEEGRRVRDGRAHANRAGHRRPGHGDQ